MDAVTSYKYNAAGSCLPEKTTLLTGTQWWGQDMGILSGTACIGLSFLYTVQY